MQYEQEDAPHEYQAKSNFVRLYRRIHQAQRSERAISLWSIHVSVQ